MYVERYVELFRGHKEWPESLFIQEFSMVVTIDKSINKMVFLDAANKFVDGFPGEFSRVCDNRRVKSIVCFLAGVWIWID